LNACLALSARQLARTQSFSSETADYYRGHCIEILIPLLSNPALHQDIDVMLASIVILRLEEQISCKLPTRNPYIIFHVIDFDAQVRSMRMIFSATFLVVPRSSILESTGILQVVSQKLPSGPS
jgi:hypothetical protein